MPAIDDLNNIASRLEAAANALGAAAASASDIVKTHQGKEAVITQHVARLNAVANAVANATNALVEAAK
jgi:hypothetical protein